METTILDGLRIQTVLDAGFFIYGKERDPKSHRHLNHELYFVEEGTVEIWCEGSIVSCTGENVFFIPKGKDHNVRALSEKASLYSFRFSVLRTEEINGSTAESEAFLRGLQRMQLIQERKELFTRIGEIRGELYRQKAYFFEKIQGLLQSFYVDLIRAIADPVPEPTLPEHFSADFFSGSANLLRGYRSDIPHEFYMDLLDEYFTHFYRNAPLLQDLAQLLHLSVSQTQRLIKSHYGVSFREKLTQARLKEAKRLIGEDRVSMEAIAEQIGYNSYSGFFDAFQEQMGVTPSQYRQTCLKEKLK